MTAVKKLKTLMVVGITSMAPLIAVGHSTIENYSDVTDARLINPEDRNWLSYRGNLEG